MQFKDRGSTITHGKLISLGAKKMSPQEILQWKEPDLLAVSFSLEYHQETNLP